MINLKLFSSTIIIVTLVTFVIFSYQLYEKDTLNHNPCKSLAQYIGYQVNVISNAIFKKLELETTPHKKPYPLCYVSDDAKLQVTKQCKLKFAITSKFVDEVQLDVVPLDIRGIVLGSHYLYERKAIFFKEENKYHLTKDGVEYIVREHSNIA